MGTGGSKNQSSANKVVPTDRKSLVESDKSKDSPRLKDEYNKKKTKIKNEELEDDQDLKPIKQVIEQDKEKIAKSKLSKYEEIQYSPKCNQNDIGEALPDFMWDQKGKEHLQKHLDFKKIPENQEHIPTLSSCERARENLVQTSDNESEYQNAENIKQSMGLANIMNKYDMKTTSELKSYANKNVSIKTKKKEDGLGEYNETLIFVQRKYKTAKKVDSDDDKKKAMENVKKHVNYAKMLRLKKKKKMTEDLYGHKELLCPLANAGLQPTKFLLEDGYGVKNNGILEFKAPNNDDENPNHDNFFKYKNSQNPARAFKTEPFKVQDMQIESYSDFMFDKEMLDNMKKERQFLQASNMIHKSKNSNNDGFNPKYITNHDYLLKSQNRRNYLSSKSPNATSRQYKKSDDYIKTQIDSITGSHSPRNHLENSSFNKTQTFLKSPMKPDKNQSNTQNYNTLSSPGVFKKLTQGFVKTDDSKKFFSTNNSISVGPIAGKENTQLSSNVLRTHSVMTKGPKEDRKFDKLNRINTYGFNQENQNNSNRHTEEKLQKTVLRKTHESKGLEVNAI